MVLQHMTTTKKRPSSDSLLHKSLGRTIHNILTQITLTPTNMIPIRAQSHLQRRGDMSAAGQLLQEQVLSDRLEIDMYLFQ